MFKIVTLGEIMLRLSTENNKRFSQSSSFQGDYGGSEANVAISLANFGINSEFVTKIPNNPLSESLLKYLKSNDVCTTNCILGGERLGTYYLEVGTSVRSSSVIYDRKYSSFSTLNFSELNINSILDNCKILHLSGITPALSNSCRDLMIFIIREAKNRGILISFDFNYRSKLWTIEEASEVLTTYLPYIDICFAGILDAKYILKISLQESSLNFVDNLNNYYNIIAKKYPNIKYFLSTERIVHSVHEKRLTGFLYTNNKVFSAQSYNFQIVDRVGGGDAFAAGALYGIATSLPAQETIDFATGASVYKHTIKGDANLAKKDEIYNLINNNISSVSR